MMETQSIKKMWVVLSVWWRSNSIKGIRSAGRSCCAAPKPCSQSQRMEESIFFFFFYLDQCFSAQTQTHTHAHTHWLSVLWILLISMLLFTENKCLSTLFMLVDLAMCASIFVFPPEIWEKFKQFLPHASIFGVATGRCVFFFLNQDCAHNKNKSIVIPDANISAAGWLFLPS